MTTTAVATTVLPATRKTVPATENYTMKAYKQSLLPNGFYHMSVNLYRDNKKVAVIEDKGDGGMLWMHFEAKDIQEERKRFDAWVEDFLVLNPKNMIGGEADAEFAQHVLLEEAGSLRDLKRAKGTVFATEEDIAKGETINLKKKLDVAYLRDGILQKFGEDILFWDDEDLTWKAVKDLPAAS